MTEERLAHILNQQFTIFYAQMIHHMDQRFKEAALRVDGQDERIDKLYILTNDVAKRLEDFIDEQTVINHRHNAWIHQLADVTKTKPLPQRH